MLADLSLPEALALLVTLAGILNRVVEYTIGTAFDKIEKLKPFRWALMYLVLALGVLSAFQFDLDMLVIFDFPASGLGRILTGIILSGGANLINDLWPQKKPATDMARATLEVPVESNMSAKIDSKSDSGGGGNLAGGRHG